MPHLKKLRRIGLCVVVAVSSFGISAGAWAQDDASQAATRLTVDSQVAMGWHDRDHARGLVLADGDDQPQTADDQEGDDSDQPQQSPQPQQVDMPAPNAPSGPDAASGNDAPTQPASSVPATSGLSPSGIPLCQHDPTKWHGLVERNSDGSIRCTYQHEHGSDPHALDSVFGSLNDLPGQEIGYAWLTSAMENSDEPITNMPTADGRAWAGGKHRFFKWETITSADLAAAHINGCPPNDNATYGFNNVRMEVHADGISGDNIRFHSFYTQAQACSARDSSYHGIIKIGGYFDYGRLLGLERTPSGEKDVRIPLPGIDSPDDPYTTMRRTHGTTGGSCSGCSSAVRGDFTWYGANATPWTGTNGPTIAVSDGIRENDWGPVDPNNPNGPIHFYAPPGDPKYDHGWAAPLDIFAADIPQANQLPGAVMNADGTYSWSGFVDAHGNVVNSCSSWSPNCIPASLTNVRPGSHQFANDTTRLPDRNYDVVVNGQTLISFPN